MEQILSFFYMRKKKTKTQKFIILPKDTQQERGRTRTDFLRARGMNKALEMSWFTKRGSEILICTECGATCKKGRREGHVGGCERREIHTGDPLLQAG